MREAPGKREAPPSSSLKFETIEVNCTRYRILVFSTVALIRKEKDVGEIAREEGEEEEDCGRRSKGVYFLPANLRSERFRYERRRRILSLGKRIFFNEGGGEFSIASRFVGHEEEEEDVPLSLERCVCVWDAFCAIQV